MVLCPPADQIDHIANGVGATIFNGKAPFHRNVRYLLNQCWPEFLDQSDEQLKRTWVTEGVLCSALKVGGVISPCVEQTCADLYLSRQLALLPDAFVIALGRKAEHRLIKAGRKQGTFFPVRAAGMPVGNKEKAQAGWMAAGAAFRAFLKHEIQPTAG